MANDKNEKTITELYEFLQENMVTKKEHEKTTTEIYEFLQENMVTKKEHEKTTTEIYEFLQEHMVTREEFNELGGKVDGLTGKVDGLTGKVDGLTGKVDGLTGKVDRMEEQMATKKDLGLLKTELKDHIDDKLSDLRGDIVILMRKEDYKVLHLVKLLKEKNILSDKEVRELVKMEPFPNTAL